MTVNILDKRKYWKTCECEHCGSLLGFDMNDTFFNPPIDSSISFNDLLAQMEKGYHATCVTCPNCHQNTRITRDEKAVL